MATGYGYGQSGFGRRAATPTTKRPTPPKQYTIPSQYVPPNYKNPGGGPVSGTLPYLLGVLNPGKQPVSLGATSLPGYYGGDPRSFASSGGYPGGGGGGGGGGYDPNGWKGDPGYMMALAAQQQGNTQLDAWLKQGRTSSLIDFGDPNLAIPGFNLDPATKALIQQNYKSGNAQLARLDQNHALGLKSVIDTLAGRGLLNSGETGYEQGQQNQLYGHNVYDARNSLLSHLSDQYQQYLQQRQALQSQVVQAAQSAYANYANQMMNSGY